MTVIAMKPTPVEYKVQISGFYVFVALVKHLIIFN